MSIEDKDSVTLAGLAGYLAGMSVSLSDWADWVAGAGAGDTAGYLREMAQDAEALSERIAQKVTEANAGG